VCQIFNHSKALARADGDVKLLKILIRLFLDDYPYLLEQIKQAMATSDTKMLAWAANDFRTALITLGAQNVCETLLALETMGINDELEDAETALRQLQEQVKQLERELLEYEKAPVI